MLYFSKLHGLGNDFIIFDGIKQELPSYSELAKKVCDRHFGIGADGLMIVETSTKADIKMIFYNADGSEAPMCGNGIRCFSKFVFDKEYIKEKSFSVETLAGIMNVDVFLKDEKVKEVKVNLGQPSFIPEDIPVITNKENFIDEKIIFNKEKYKISAIKIGSIHSVIFVDNFNNVNIKEIGPFIENNSLFPNKINLNLCKIIDRDNIEVLTWERGVGQTLSCGTGACACAVVSNIIYNCNKRLNVSLLGGSVEIEQENNHVFMKGPAVLICNGVYYYN